MEGPFKITPCKSLPLGVWGWGGREEGVMFHQGSDICTVGHVAGVKMEMCCLWASSEDVSCSTEFLGGAWPGRCLIANMTEESLLGWPGRCLIANGWELGAQRENEFMQNYFLTHFLYF